MNTISGPFGLPQSCAEMVRPSGVFTHTALNFLSCAVAGAATAATSSAAIEMPANRQPSDACAMKVLPVLRPDAESVDCNRKPPRPCRACRALSASVHPPHRRRNQEALRCFHQNGATMWTLPIIAAHSPRCGGRIDHLAHFRDLRRRKTADLSVLADDGLVLGEIDAERLVVGDEALDPLNVGAELMQHLVRFRGGPAQLLALEAADLRDVSLDDESAQRHSVLL